jgi:C-5 cytosine-specific DNA methylase
MRPKMPILLYCADREVLSITAFALRLHSYEVIAAHDVRDAVNKSAHGLVACGVLIHAQQGDPAGRLIHRILESAAPIPLLLVDRAGDLAPVRYADIVLYGRNTSMAHILGALDVLCARLQGFPDDYTLVEYRGKLAADGPRYKALGNSMAVPVMRWIGERIAAVDAILRDGRDNEGAG